MLRSSYLIGIGAIEANIYHLRRFTFFFLPPEMRIFERYIGGGSMTKCLPVGDRMKSRTRQRRRNEILLGTAFALRVLFLNTRTTFTMSFLICPWVRNDFTARHSVMRWISSMRASCISPLTHHLSSSMKECRPDDYKMSTNKFPLWHKDRFFHTAGYLHRVSKVFVQFVLMWFAVRRFDIQQHDNRDLTWASLPKAFHTNFPATSSLTSTLPNFVAHVYDAMRVFDISIMKMWAQIVRADLSAQTSIYRLIVRLSIASNNDDSVVHHQSTSEGECQNLRLILNQIHKLCTSSPLLYFGLIPLSLQVPCGFLFCNEMHTQCKQSERLKSARKLHLLVKPHLNFVGLDWSSMEY